MTALAPARDAGVLFGRSARLTLTAKGLATSVIGPLAYLAGFAITLGNLLGHHGTDPGQYLPPAIAVQTAMTGAIGTAFTVAADRRSGMIDRLLVLPIRRAAVPVAYLMAHAVRAAVPLAAVVLAGLVVLGFRFHGGPVATAGFFTLVLGFGLCLALGGVAIGWSATDPEALSSLLYLPYLPLFILSTGLVPVEAFPGWLQPVVAHSPVSAVTDAARGLAGGGPYGAAGEALAWMAVLLCGFGLLVRRAVRRRR